MLLAFHAVTKATALAKTLAEKKNYYYLGQSLKPFHNYIRYAKIQRMSNLRTLPFSVAQANAISAKILKTILREFERKKIKKFSKSVCNFGNACIPLKISSLC